MKADRLRIATEADRPETIDLDLQALLNEDASLGELVIVERNPWKVALADSRLARMAEEAQQAIRDGDHLTAESLAYRVMEAEPNYSFARTIFVEALGFNADTTPDQLMGLRLREINLLHEQILGLTPFAETAGPLDERGLWFEIARHHFNLGDDLHDRAAESGDVADWKRAADHFRLSRALTPADEFPANYMARLLREAVAWQRLGQMEKTRHLVQASISLSGKFTRDYLARSNQFSEVYDLALSLIAKGNPS